MQTKNLEINRANAVKAYNSANKEGKTLLSDLFGSQVFNQKITDLVKTFDDVLAFAGITDEHYEKVISGLSKDEAAYWKVKLIAQVLNEGWKPDWTNSNEYKYQPWLKFTAGSGFAFDGCGYDHSLTRVGSRLCYKSRALAEYAATQFQDIYNDFLL